jgi:hypothetical protein
LFDIDSVSKKALTLVGNELKLVAKGEKSSFNVAELAEKAKEKSQNALDSFTRKTLSQTGRPVKDTPASGKTGKE